MSARAKTQRAFLRAALALALAALAGACDPPSAESCSTNFNGVYLPPGVGMCPSSVTEGCCVSQNQLGSVLDAAVEDDAAADDAQDGNPG